MNEKVQIQKLRDDVDWFIYQSIMLQNTFSAIEAVSEVCQQTSALGTYGDYFAYSQNMMISEVQLQLAKLYVSNKDSHSLPKVIDTAKVLFTERYYQSTGYNSQKAYKELKELLEDLGKKLNGFETTICNLKKLRNKDLAHLDKTITNVDSRDELVTNNPIFLRDVKSLIDFSFEAPSRIKGIMFNVTPAFIPRDYVGELQMIARAIEKQEDKK